MSFSFLSHVKTLHLWNLIIITTLVVTELKFTWLFTVVVNKCFCSTNGFCSFSIARIFLESSTATLGILSLSTPSRSLTLFWLVRCWLEVAAVVESLRSLNKFFSLSGEPVPLLVTNWRCKSWIREFTSPETNVTQFNIMRLLYTE